MVNLRSVPFLKIMLPYLAGIVLAINSRPFLFQHHAFFACFALAVLAFVLLRLVRQRLYWQLKTAYLIFVNLFLLLLAFETTWAYRQVNDRNHYSHYIGSPSEKTPVLGVVSDLPVPAEKFLKVPLRIEAIYRHNAWRPSSGSTIVYVAKDAAGTIGLNSRLAVNAAFSAIQPPANPYEFDYAAYLKDRNIGHVLFAKAGDLQVLGHDESLSLSSLGAYLKGQTVETLRSSGLSQDAFAICSALLVGYDDEIDGSVMSSFSHSGTLHVLSVSGLHTGILYACVMALFGLFDKYNKRKVLKCAVTLLCLLLLAAITGFAPAVCRAVVMLSLVLIGQTFFRNGHSLNTLLFSAFILMLFDPLLIRDLGFLLSYFAVFGIIYMYPKLSALYRPGNKILKWAWDSSLLSISATLFTLPVSLYYFHQFPTWFIFSNLVIIPMSIAIMLGAVLLLALHKVLLLKTAIVYLINLLTGWMIRCSQLTDTAGTGYIDNIHFTRMDMLWMSAAIVLAFMVMERKRFAYVLGLGLLCTAWLLSSAYNVAAGNKLSELIVLKTKRSNSILLKRQGRIYYLGDPLSAREFDRLVKPYLQQVHYRELVMLNHYNFIRSGSQSICLLDKHVPNHIAKLIRADTWLVSDHRRRKDTAIFAFEHARQVIVTVGNSKNYLVTLRRQCTLNQVAFHSTHTDGAYRSRLE